MLSMRRYGDLFKKAVAAFNEDYASSMGAALAYYTTFSLAPLVTATVHPSSILRAPSDDARHEEMRKFVDDLKTIARAIAASS